MDKVFHLWEVELCLSFFSSLWLEKNASLILHIVMPKRIILLFIIMSLICLFLLSSITIFGTGAKWLAVLQERNLNPGELWS